VYTKYDERDPGNYYVLSRDGRRSMQREYPESVLFELVPEQEVTSELREIQERFLLCEAYAKEIPEGGE